MVLGPVLRPLKRLASRLLNRWTVRLLWSGALASYGFWPYTVNAASVAIRVLGFAAFTASTPLALMGTFSLRQRRRAEQARYAALQSLGRRAPAGRRPARMSMFIEDLIRRIAR